MLVVEDHHGLRTYISELLAPRYRVLAAVDGLHGLEVLQRETVDLVLSDVMMPQLDGYGRRARLRESDDLRHLPVVFLTARGEDDDRLTAVRLGVDDYLVKPFDARQLLATIGSLLKDRLPRRAEPSPSGGAPTDEESDDPTANPPRPVMTAGDQTWLAEFETYLSARLHDDRLSVPMMGDDFAMSESTLLRQLRRLTGLRPPSTSRRSVWRKPGASSTRGTDVSVKEVAAAVGYDNVRTFSRSFSRRFGVLPSEYVSQALDTSTDATAAGRV